MLYNIKYCAALCRIATTDAACALLYNTGDDRAEFAGLALASCHDSPANAALWTCVPVARHVSVRQRFGTHGVVGTLVMCSFAARCQRRGCAARHPLPWLGYPNWSVVEIRMALFTCHIAGGDTFTTAEPDVRVQDARCNQHYAFPSRIVEYNFFFSLGLV